MSDLVAPTPARAGEAPGVAAAGAAAAGAVGGGARPAVAELAGETASPPPATFTAVINIKCPDQTGVVSVLRWFSRTGRVTTVCIRLVQVTWAGNV